MRSARKNYPLLYILPCVVFLFIFVIAYPFGYNIYTSLHSFSLIFPERKQFVGVENFISLFRDRFFLNAVFVTARIVITTLLIQVFLGLGIALLLNNEFKGRSIARVLLLIPLASIPVVNGFLFQLLFFPSASVVNDILMRLGVVSDHLPWLTNSTLATMAVVATDCWQWTPFIMLIILAGLQSIPLEPLELARMDGLKSFQVFFKVTLPRLKFVLTIAILIRLMDLLRLFDVIFSLTKGGPQSATETLAYYIYRTGFRTFNVGMASASSLVVWAVIFIIAFITIKKVFTRGEPGYE